MYINAKLMSHPEDVVRDRGDLYKSLFLCIFRNAAYANRGGIRCCESVTNRESDINYRPKRDLDIHFLGTMQKRGLRTGSTRGASARMWHAGRCSMSRCATAEASARSRAATASAAFSQIDD
jgi:hypothetical protein